MDNFEIVHGYPYRIMIEFVLQAIMDYYKDNLKDGNTFELSMRSLNTSVKIDFVEDIIIKCEYQSHAETYGMYVIDGPLKLNKNGKVNEIIIDMHLGGLDENEHKQSLLDTIADCRSILYHEINHFFDDYIEFKFNNSSLYDKLLKDNSDIRYNKIVEFMTDEKYIDSPLSDATKLIYYLLIPTEFNAYVAQAYADCVTYDFDNIFGFVSKSSTYKIYQGLNSSETRVVVTHRCRHIPYTQPIFSDNYLSRNNITNIRDYVEWYKKIIPQKIELYRESIVNLAQLYIANKKIKNLNESFNKFKSQLNENDNTYVFANINVKENDVTVTRRVCINKTFFDYLYEL